jgi:DNA-binding Lrp family transcriptional regulator
MAPDLFDAPVASAGRLDDRVLSTLQGLHGRIAFNGLRRALGAHPESLSRSLRRLEREGLVERVDGGYRALETDGSAAEELTANLRSIAGVGLPPGTAPDVVLARLTGHWFGGLRWVGVVERPDGRLLAWTRRDGTSPVLVGIRKGTLHVYVPDEATGRDDASESEDAAYELLVHAVEALRPVPADRWDGASYLRALPEIERPQFVAN